MKPKNGFIGRLTLVVGVALAFAGITSLTSASRESDVPGVVSHHTVEASPLVSNMGFSIEGHRPRGDKCVSVYGDVGSFERYTKEVNGDGEISFDVPEGSCVMWTSEGSAEAHLNGNTFGPTRFPAYKGGTMKFRNKGHSGCSKITLLVREIP